MTTQTRADLALLLMAIVWGASFVVMKSALAASTPVLLLAIRFTLAAVLMLVLAFALGLKWSRSGRGSILLTGSFLAAAYVLQTTGLRLTTAGKSGFLTGLYIVLLPLLTFLVYQSAPRPREWAAVTMSALGMAAMNWDGTGWTWGWGESLTAGCAVMFAAHLLALGRAVRLMDARLAGLGQIVVCAVLLWLVLPVAESPRIVWSPAMVGAILFTAAFATALPLTLMGWAQQHTSPVRTGLLLSLEMPAAALAGWWWLNEPFRGMMLVGAALILGGVLLVELKPGASPGHLDQ